MNTFKELKNILGETWNYGLSEQVMLIAQKLEF